MGERPTPIVPKKRPSSNIDPGWKAMFDSDEEMEMWDGMTPKERRSYLLEEQWNEKQDRISYFWKVVAAIAIAVAIVVAIVVAFL